MLRMPPLGKKREILFIYGHHSSLERWFGVAQYFNKYGGVTIPDLPGFGGMDPLYKIGKRPTLDEMADYLAAFIKLRFKRQKFTLVGLSLGFMIIIRTLQKYPELAGKVDMLVSFAGFSHHDDFRFSRRTFLMWRWGSSFFSHYLSAAFLKHVAFKRPFILAGYAVAEKVFISDVHSKIRSANDKEERKKRIDFEVRLWQCNDPQTYASMAVTMFTLDLTGEHVDLPVHHIAVDTDRYFDAVRVEAHMRMIFKDFRPISIDVPAHAPSVLATAEDTEPFVPPALRRLLNRKTS